MQKLIETLPAYKGTVMARKQVDWEVVAHHFLSNRKASIMSAVGQLRLIYRVSKSSNDVIVLRKSAFKEIEEPTTIEMKNFLFGLSTIFRLMTK